MIEYKNIGGNISLQTINIDYESRLLDIVEAIDGEIYVLLKEPVCDWLDQTVPEQWWWRWEWHRGENPGPGHGELTVPEGMETWFWTRWA
jgi:hypothetical protein